MARSFGTIPPNNGLPELQKGSLQHKPSEQFFSIYQRDAKSYLGRSQVGFNGATTNFVESEIHYWFGSGNHARSYIHRTPAGELIELPLTWYAENGGYWGMSPAYDQPDHAGFSRKITYRCLFCHNGYPQTESGTANWEGSTRFPERLPEGIDCQRCHGPGQNHVDEVRNKQPPERVKSAIVNPARLAPERQMEVCMQCHLETSSLKLPGALMRYDRQVFSYCPGEPLEDYMLHFDHAPGTGHDDKFEFASSPYRLRKSECFLKSKGSLTCTTCHNPHDVPRGASASAYYSQVCRSCHAGTVAKLVSEERHPASLDCVACHMPKRRPSDAIHVTVTDHYVQKKPANLAAPQVELHDNNAAPYRGPVALYYPPALPSTPENELYLAVAQVKQQSNMQEGLPRLEKAIAQYAPQRSEFYFELAEAYRYTGRLYKAIASYQEACRRTPADWRHFFALGTALAAAGNLDQSRAALQRALTLNPKEGVVYRAMADALTLEGKLQDAVSTLQTAKAIDPESADTRNNLGTALLRVGDAAAAERELREAVRLRPEVTAIRVNLASLLARRGNFPEAKYEFESALRRNSSFAEGHSAYATALAANGNLEEARTHYRQALAVNPRLAITRNNLGAVLVRLGDTDGAIREYRQAVADDPNSAAAHFNLGLILVGQGKIPEAEQHLLDTLKYDPNHFEAHLKLGEIHLQRGDSAGATAHLRKAAESPDLRLRKAANDLLASINQ
jgi:predicted CXXCH cytochrome family protein